MIISLEKLIQFLLHNAILAWYMQNPTATPSHKKPLYKTWSI